jgi:hypothetical protein
MNSILRLLLSTIAAAWIVLVVTLSTIRGAEPLPKELAKYEALIKPEHRLHWAFQMVKRPGVPVIRNTAWVRNPIDAFVQAKLESRGWQPAPAADPRAFVRRIYLDVIGIPPTRLEQEAFLNDSSPQAIDRLVQNLLSRPGYGERWGRYWLDMVRYAETNGYERDATKPHVWRYRDYVIKSFNDDKPFDRFILEQLAGDELPDASPETLIATGYYRLGPWDDEPADPEEDRFDQLDDMINTTSQVFLGMTLACARCHNHKFEPLTMLDYYRMAAIFNPLQRPRPGRDDVDLPIGSPKQLEEIARIERQITSIRRAFCSQAASTVGLSVSFSRWLTPAMANHSDTEIKKIRELQARLPKLPRGYFLTEPTAAAPTTNLLLRGKASRPGPVVPPGMPTVFVSHQPDFLSPGERTSRRRLTLAQWIARTDNPLTARVIVNRVWQFHFGEGLVRTPSDFGVKGDPPTHPELLDWLADWFVHEGWSLKKLHALILTSNTYRLSKQWNSDYGEKDPEDRLLWRFPYRRLEAEAIRDSILAVSGQLNSQMCGPSMFPQVPQQALEGHSDPDKIWKSSNENESSRRTVYAFIKRSMVVPMLEVLDLCDTTRTSAKRSVTTVAPQALTLFNGEFVNRQAIHFARRLEREVGSDPEKQIELAYSLALCREPTQKEKTAMLDYLKREKENLGKETSGHGSINAKQRALEQMCRVLFNLNEFVYSD